MTRAQGTLMLCPGVSVALVSLLYDWMIAGPFAGKPAVVDRDCKVSPCITVWDGQQGVPAIVRNNETSVFCHHASSVADKRLCYIDT